MINHIKGTVEPQPPVASKRQSNTSGSGEDDKKFDPVKAALKLFAKNTYCFHNSRHEAYITIIEKLGKATYDLRSERFALSLRSHFFACYQRFLTEQDFCIVRNILICRAFENGQTDDVAYRVAGHDGAIFFDLGNTKRQVIKITRDGYAVVKDPPVHFIRPSGAEAIPQPRRTSSSLRKVLRNIFPLWSESDLVLLAAFLVGSLRPKGPYPILQLIGGSGAVKSTTAKIIKRLIDPNVADNRGLPRNEQDLALSGRNQWVLSFDNLSAIKPWLSDALCRLSTGGGFATRKLFSDTDEILIPLQRPVILNGIGDVIERGDLRDRTIAVHLPEIPEGKRRTEDQVWKDVELYWPTILGALLNCVVTALAKPVLVKNLPRMADWFCFIKAAEPAMGFELGLFETAYRADRTRASEGVIDLSPIALLLIELMDGR